jgi:hypothetical protein
VTIQTMIRSKPFSEGFSWINRYQDYVPLWAKDTDATSRKRKLRGLTFVGISIFIILLIPLVFFGLGASDGTFVDASGGGNGAKGLAHSGSWTKPKGLTVVALVFYGRRANVQILERYLRVRYLSTIINFFILDMGQGGGLIVEKSGG